MHPVSRTTRTHNPELERSASQGAQLRLEGFLERTASFGHYTLGVSGGVESEFAIKNSGALAHS